MSILYVVATPIGNLEDISLRALDVIKKADLILAEDTRVTKKLLDRYDIVKPLISYHQHSTFNKVKELIKNISETQNTVLISDAGTPGINDPGGKLIEAIVKTNLQDDPVNVVEIIPIPGANAAITALSVSGFPADKFQFLGFPPHKKGRKTFFQEVAESKITVVFYESPFRILKALAELPVNREIVVARELTKKFETIYRGKADNIIRQLTDHSDEIKGEFVVIVSGRV